MIRRLPLLSLMVVAQPLAARSILMEPRPAQVGFVDKVNSYINNVYNKTPKDGVGQVLTKALLLTQNSSTENVGAILNELGPHLIRDKNVAEQEACSASLIKILVPIVHQFEMALFHEVHTIECALEYWQYQEQHSVSYYFHKSPLKHFTFDQKEEVVGKIQMLKEERERHFELLGKINIQLSSFDSQATVHAQYAWIQKVCRLLFAYDEALKVADDAEIFPLLYEATNIVPHYKMYMHRRLEKHYIPSIFARRWMEMMAGAAALAGGGWYSYTHQEILNNYYEKTKGYFTDTKNIVFGKSDHTDVDRQYGDYENKLKNLSTTRSDLNTIQEMIRDKKPRSDITRKMIGFYFDTCIDGCRHIFKELKEIISSNAKKSPGLVEHMANYFLATKELRPKLEQVANQIDSEDLSKDSTDLKEQLPFPVGESFNESYNTFKLWIALQKVESPRIWGLIRSAPFTVPFSIITWKVGRALYKRCRVMPDCESIRVALVDIALLLNVYGDAAPERMDSTDFGRLAYLAHKLELEVGLVPKNYRESFLLEVGLLHTSSLNAQQKMKVIDLMYKKYPFLSFQGMKVT